MNRTRFLLFAALAFTVTAVDWGIGAPGAAAADQAAADGKIEKGKASHGKIPGDAKSPWKTSARDRRVAANKRLQEVLQARQVKDPTATAPDSKQRGAK